MKRISFQLSFKIFQWVLVLIIIFSTYLGYRFYQVTYQSKAIENQRFWIVTVLNKYRMRSDTMSFLARQYLLNLKAHNLSQYQELLNQKSLLIHAGAEQQVSLSQSTSKVSDDVVYRPFTQLEHILLKEMIDDDKKLRAIEARQFDRVAGLRGSNYQNKKIAVKGLQTEQYLKLNLALMSMTKQLLDSVNQRFLTKAEKMDNERKSLIYNIPIVLCINIVLLVLSLLFINKRMGKYHSDLEGLSIKDFLTGIHNRKYLMETGPMLLALNRREHSKVALLLLDIDHFKAVNDKYGHDSGDKVLQAFSNTIIERMRKGDIFSRVGGEEFVLVLNKITESEAEKFANELRVLLSSSSVSTANGDVSYTVSIGVIMSDDTSELKSLIDNADKALYKAKRGGRDKVVMFQQKCFVNTLAV
jgi:diguanylate cyclase (GGDEF)-like protein